MGVIAPRVVSCFSPNATGVMTQRKIADKPQEHTADATQHMRIVFRWICGEGMRREVIEDDVVAPGSTKMRNADDFRIWKTGAVEHNKAGELAVRLFRDVGSDLFFVVYIWELN